MEHFLLDLAFAAIVALLWQPDIIFALKEAQRHGSEGFFLVETYYFVLLQTGFGESLIECSGA